MAIDEFDREPNSRPNALRNGAHLHPLDVPVEPLSCSEQLSSSLDWPTEADELIDAGVTRIGRDKAAVVLAELAHGTAPSTVARRAGVGYATVTRIAETIELGLRADLAENPDRPRMPVIVCTD
jgi:hypothetical protein